MKDLDVKNFNDLRDVFKLMVGEMIESGLEGGNSMMNSVIQSMTIVTKKVKIVVTVTPKRL